MTTPISHKPPPSFAPPASSSGSGSGQPAGAASASGAAAAGSGKAGDQVKLTDSALALQNAARPDEGVVDQQRVAQIRAAIADGSYTVNPGRIAEKMLALEAQLAGSGKA